MRLRLLLPLILVLPGCASLQQKPEEPLAGSWGGQHIGLVLTAAGGTLSYDCAAGRIDGPVLPNTIGEFHVRGTHTAGGAVGEVPRSMPALYHGSIKGDVMTLRVIVPATGQVIGPAELTRGQEPVIARCR